MTAAQDAQPNSDWAEWFSSHTEALEMAREAQTMAEFGSSLKRLRVDMGMSLTNVLAAQPPGGWLTKATLSRVCQGQSLFRCQEQVVAYATACGAGHKAELWVAEWKRVREARRGKSSTDLETENSPRGVDTPVVGPGADDQGSAGARQRRTRAVALRNREQIIRAAVDLIVEQGPTVPMEVIARRAEVGIATLYRHFPDRSVLLRQVALETLRQCTVEATAALAEEPDAFHALSRYMHDSIDLLVGAVMPVLIDRIVMDDELQAARAASRVAVGALVTAAHREGSLRPEVTSGDISMLIIRFTPPLPGAMDPECNHQLSHRHLTLLLDGLRVMHGTDLPGPALSVDELTCIRPGPGPGYAGMTAVLRSKNRKHCRASGPHS